MNFFKKLFKSNNSDQKSNSVKKHEFRNTSHRVIFKEDVVLATHKALEEYAQTFKDLAKYDRGTENYRSVSR